MRASVFILLSGLALAANPASAEFDFSIYGGGNTNSHSDVEISGTGGTNGSFFTAWDGAPFDTPPYWGLRGTYWASDFGMPNWGFAIDYAHAKAKADLGDLPADVERLEFTDGLNLVTANALYRHPLNERFDVYGGLGAGASIPHVEFTNAGGETFEYQLTGPAVQALAGASVELGWGVSAFGEYKASYSWNEADLDGGGTLETDILTHHFALGLSYAFGQ